MTAQFFEDFPVGRVIATRGVTLTDEAVISFAQAYDPQPIHCDRMAAADGPFGELIASGFQTLSVAWRLFVDTGALRDASLGGPAMDEVRWLAPVKAGATLSARVGVAAAIPSRSKPDRGAITWTFEIFADRDHLVCTARVTSILRRRPD
jgi:acyl dehydratase